jgi:hypothetical protein
MKNKGKYLKEEKICGNCIHFIATYSFVGVDGYCEVGGRVDEHNKNLICYENSFCIGVDYFESVEKNRS